jgi:hypothetical protein
MDETLIVRRVGVARRGEILDGWLIGGRCSLLKQPEPSAVAEHGGPAIEPPREAGTMLKVAIIRVGVLGVVWGLIGSATVLAQVGGTGSAMSPTSMMANPYLNPYLNPYMNPMATQQPMNAQNAMLYMYMANSANGGIGSGRISGTRGAGATQAKAKVAEMPYTAHPGGGASRYFNPGTGSGNMSGRYYNQRGRYFQNNGH